MLTSRDHLFLSVVCSHMSQLDGMCVRAREMPPCLSYELLVSMSVTIGTDPELVSGMWLCGSYWMVRVLEHERCLHACHMSRW